MNFERRPNLLLIAAVAVTAVAYLLLVFVPGKKAIELARRELRAKQDFIVEAARLPVQLEEIDREMAATREYTERWQQRASSASIPVVFGSVAELAQESGARTTRVVPDNPVDYVGLRQQPLHLACEGELPQIWRLLHGIEQIPAAIWLRRLKIEKTRADSENVQCEMDLAVFTADSENSD